MIFVDFNKSFYSLQAIKAAMDAYRDFVDFRLECGKKTTRVVFKKVSEGDPEVIKNEFSNYVLFLTLTKQKYG